jgi:hypothetical protein
VSGETQPKRSDAILSSEPGATTGGAIGVPPGYTARRTYRPDARYRPAGKYEAKHGNASSSGFYRQSLEGPPAPGFYDAEPLYTEGFEYMPSTWGPDDVADLQSALVDAGLITRGTKYRRGVYDQATQSAFTRLLGYANSRGETWTDALRSYSDSFEVEAGEQEEALPVTSSADLDAIARAQARELLGSGNLAAKHRGALVGGYQQAQRSASGELAPDVDVFMEQKLRELEPDRYDARKVVRGLRAAHEFLGGDTA